MRTPTQRPRPTTRRNQRRRKETSAKARETQTRRGRGGGRSDCCRNRRVYTIDAAAQLLVSQAYLQSRTGDLAELAVEQILQPRAVAGVEPLAG